MGIILKVILSIIILIGGTGTYLHQNPEKISPLVLSSLNKILPEDSSITPKVLELINKNPKEEQDFAQQKETPTEIKQELNEQELSLLGRPKKIVEFHCTNDMQCIEYFRNSNSKCEQISGDCYG